MFKEVAVCDGPQCVTEEVIGPDDAPITRGGRVPKNMIVIRLEQARQELKHPTGLYFFCTSTCLARWAVSASHDGPIEVRFAGTPIA